MTRKDDLGRDRWDLIPYRALSEVVHVLTHGAAKYADNNWQTVPHQQQRYFAACMRHIVAWRLGEQRDAETGNHHLAHAVCCLLFLTSHELGHDPHEEET